MNIRFLRWENSQDLGSWSGGPAANLQIPRVGDEIIKIMNVPNDDEEGNTYEAVFKVEKVVWLGLDEVNIIIRERTI
jgi:hypothetical protein